KHRRAIDQHVVVGDSGNAAGEKAPFIVVERVDLDADFRGGANQTDVARSYENLSEQFRSGGQNRDGFAAAKEGSGGDARHLLERALFRSEERQASTFFIRDFQVLSYFQ